MADHTIKQGNTLPMVEDQITVGNGVHPNLAGSDIEFWMEPLEGSEELEQLQAASIDDVLAKVRYQFTAVQTEQWVGIWAYNWHITFSDGSTMDYPTKGFRTVEIEPRIGGAKRPIMYTPTTREVAQSYLMARTRNSHGGLIGDFTEDTSVTNEQALISIENAVKEMREKIGNVQPDQIEAAKRAAMLLSAANIEMSYFPKEAAQANSVYDKLMARYKDAIADVTISVEVEEEEQADQVGSFGFPPSENWGTRRW